MGDNAKQLLFENPQSIFADFVGVISSMLQHIRNCRNSMLLHVFLLASSVTATEQTVKIFNLLFASIMILLINTENKPKCKSFISNSTNWGQRCRMNTRQIAFAFPTYTWERNFANALLPKIQSWNMVAASLSRYSELTSCISAFSGFLKRDWQIFKSFGMLAATNCQCYLHFRPMFFYA